MAIAVRAVGAVEGSHVPQIIKNLLNSEKAVTVGVLIIAATVLAAVGRMSVAVWVNYTEVLAAIYVGGKTIHGSASVFADAMKVKKADSESDRALRAIGESLKATDAKADAELAKKFAKSGEIEVKE